MYLCPVKIGLIQERKNPPDNRVPLTPNQAAAFKTRFPDVDIVAEASPTRCFSDAEYQAVGIHIQTDMTDCDVLLGVKEVPVEALVPNKTYMFFSHTIKAQEYNRTLLQTILKKNIRLIDYEVINWDNGQRVLGFGHWAGIVGAYNGILTYGLKSGDFNLKPANQCQDFDEMIQEGLKVKLKPIKIVVSGTGRVGKGSIEVMEKLKIKKVSPQDFLSQTYDEAVYTHLDNSDLFARKDREEWDNQHFYANHSQYQSQFEVIYKNTDVLIHGIYWENDMPQLFTKEDTLKPEFRINVIADITCDIDGSIPITFKDTSISEPIIYWDSSLQKSAKSSSKNTIDIMAVGNLPNELPRDASTTFGEKMLDFCLPALIEEGESILTNGTMTKNGKLTDRYAYLQDFVEGE